MPSRRKRGITDGNVVQKYLIKGFKFLTLNIQLSAILTKDPMGAESISAVARKRAQIAPTFSTPPGSPFRALAPLRYPEVEPKCHRCEKDGTLSVISLKNYLIMTLKFLKIKYSN